ncbi:MAG: alanine--tRNA ligase [Clostridiales bacterium]|nr:alanine--tRNA ligase [Clostridiales bacterium]
MKNMGLNEIRSAFLEFFESKGHLVESSYSLVPQDDKSLLLVNAGMAPLKNYFTGAEVPPQNRMATCQKCIRTGDIENVGKTARHATFFEMLGNFSFGDYFKKESLEWGWEFVTEVLEIPVDKLWATVYLEDDEAYEIWKNDVKIPEDRIIRLGKADNFWEIGNGPCGPSSEIYFDRGERFGCGDSDHKPGCECDQFLEFWNHVFTQFNKNEDGTYKPLAKKNIDTGMGLERIAAIMQNVDSIFEVDTIKRVLDKVVEISGRPYNDNVKDDISIRIITDHIRAVTFLVSDGVLPNNEGRGYVLRRLLRRAARHGKLLGINGLFLRDIVNVVIEESGAAYPNLVEKQEFIKKVISIEEERFYLTIDQGMEILNGYIEIFRKSGVLPGPEAFKLYDTYGFPLDLTREILEEINMTIDEDSFNEEMEKQRDRARQARENESEVGWEEGKGSILSAFEPTQFVGYNQLHSDAVCLGIIKDLKSVENATIGDEVEIFFDKTPFYAESGGQVGDKGVVCNDESEIHILDCTKSKNGVFLHKGIIKKGTIQVNQSYSLSVNANLRSDTAKNHTTTHLLHKALRMVLGEHVEQAGSFVDSKRLRFDFTHFNALSHEELKKVETIVNKEILNALPVDVSISSLDDAKSMGATALFNEKYGKEVRVVKIGDFSMELCGGTHLTNSSQAGLFKIISEGGVAAGVRRIEALTGLNALNYFENMEETLNKVLEIIKSNKEDIVSKSSSIVEDMRKMMKENEILKSKIASSNIDEVKDKSIVLDGITIVKYGYKNADSNIIREIADRIKDQLNEYLIVLASTIDDKVIFVTMASEGAIKKGLHAGNIIREVAKIAGGNGGGRPNMAQAGGNDPEKMEFALDNVEQIAKSMLK